MKSYKNKKVKNEYLTINKAILSNTNHPLHDCLFKYADLLNYKIFIMCLHQATKVIISMKKQGLALNKGSFKLDTFYSRKNFLCNSYISKNEILGGILRIEKTTNTDFNAFFNEINLDEDGKNINFEISDLYMKELSKKSFYKVDLADLKPLKSIRALKLALIILSTKSGYKALNYLINVLEIDTYKKNGEPKKRTNIIKDIKIAFNNLNHVIFYVYQAPKNQHEAIKEGDFKFHYETLEQMQKAEEKRVEAENAKYDEVSNAWDELNKALEIEPEQDFDKLFNVDDLTFDSVDNEVKKAITENQHEYFDFDDC